MYQALPLRLSGAFIRTLDELSGRLNLQPGPGGSTASASEVTRAIFQPLLGDVLEGAWTHAMVVALWPSAQLVAHRDPPIRGWRMHLPIRLNTGCWVFHAGAWQQLEAGTAYSMDPTEEHGAVNWGPTLRLHLVIDRE